MANPRQRRKTRSSSHKPVKQSRRTNKLQRKQPPIKGPKALQDAWDKKKTVRQNFAALGLAHTLNPHDSGGNEQRHEASGRNPDANVEHRKANSHERSGVRHGFGRIMRDENGNVVGVELGEETEAQGLMEDDASEVDESASGWLLDVRRGERERGESVVQALEDASALGRGRSKRSSSVAEVAYLQRLADAHGDDIDAMARDRKRNVQQYTAGQLRRAIEKAGLTSS
ncbi:hypothetical protein BD410DRAFT_762039 [Rickenella mellea]|uniref:Nucleolar protein 16 n=1 Tax=Rickenella mellea TaxID=50990 RepID=A0A4Y7QIP4_9AGAM|nr:hypothetical protein BD410DRAFT_762039 [Rickenella mellea]